MNKQHQPMLLEQARLTHTERHKIWLALGVSKTPAKDAWSKLSLLQDESAIAATRKACEVLEQELRRRAKSYEATKPTDNLRLAQGYALNSFADMLHAQLQQEEEQK